MGAIFLKKIEPRKEEHKHFLDTVLFGEIWSPEADIYETNDEIIILIELAGVKAKDINLSIDKQNILHIWGERVSPLKKTKKECHTMELHFGMFSRYMRLWAPIEGREAKIENRNGLFKIILKKKKKNK